MTDYCTCTLPSELPKMMAMKSPSQPRMQATQCPEESFFAGNVGMNILNGIFMGIPGILDDRLDTSTEVDTTALDAIAEKNKDLKDAFSKCQTQMMKCSQKQTEDFLQANIDLTKSIQSIRDELQDQKIAKNTSLVVYSIAIGMLILVYLFALPSPTQPIQ